MSYFSTKKVSTYKGYTIEQSLSGWYCTFISNVGYIKADTLRGIKHMINDYV